MLKKFISATTFSLKTVREKSGKKVRRSKKKTALYGIYTDGQIEDC